MIAYSYYTTYQTYYYLIESSGNVLQLFEL